MDHLAIRLDERIAAGWFYLTCDGANIDDVIGDRDGLVPVVATANGLKCFCVPGADLVLTRDLARPDGLTDVGGFTLDCRSAFIASSSEEPIFRLTLVAPGSGQVFTDQVSIEERPSRVVVVLPELSSIEENLKRSWYRRVLG